MLKTKDISHTYKGQQPIRFNDIHCQPDTHWLVLGNSGCGKTTLLHMIAGLLKPTTGNVEIAGTNISALPSNQLDHFRGQKIGVVFQKPHFVRSLNVEANLMLAQYLAGIKKDKKRIESILSSLNLGHKLKSMPNELSQGEQQRVAIARAVINGPKLILADEPTSALDDENSREVINLLETQASAQQATLLIVTHDQRLKDHFPNRIQL